MHCRAEKVLQIPHIREPCYACDSTKQRQQQTLLPGVFCWERSTSSNTDNTEVILLHKQ